MMRQPYKTLLLWVVLIVAFLAIWRFLSSEEPEPIPYSAFTAIVRDPKQASQIDEVLIKGRNYRIKLKPKPGKEPEERVTVGPSEEDGKLLLDRGIKVVFEESSDKGVGPLLSILLPMLFLVVMFYLFMRQLQAGGNKALNFGRSKIRLFSESQKKSTFADVIGADAAKEALAETVAFLRNPKAFEKTGSRVRKGILLTGPPGTGKTLLARALAGEADVPFFSISGSDFVEMFVGVGASRVRDTFEQGKKHAPCIIFIDELDAVGRQRGAGLGGGHDEREQTLNQLLSELDGFEPQEGSKQKPIVVIAATNRVDVLDSALLRPGRFDRIISVPLPELATRRALLDHYMSKKPIAEDVVDGFRASLAVRSAGLGGADIESLVNEAAILAARRGRDHLRRADFEDALYRVGHRLPVTPRDGADDDDAAALLQQAVSGQVAGQPDALRALAHALCSHYGDSAVATDLEFEQRHEDGGAEGRF